MTCGSDVYAHGQPYTDALDLTDVALVGTHQYLVLVPDNSTDAGTHQVVFSCLVYLRIHDFIFIKAMLERVFRRKVSGII